MNINICSVSWEKTPSLSLHSKNAPQQEMKVPQPKLACSRSPCSSRTELEHLHHQCHEQTAKSNTLFSNRHPVLVISDVVLFPDFICMSSLNGFIICLCFHFITSASHLLFLWFAFPFSSPNASSLTVKLVAHPRNLSPLKKTCLVQDGMRTTWGRMGGSVIKDFL